MAGAGGDASHPKSTSQKPSASSSQPKSRWEQPSASATNPPPDKKLSKPGQNKPNQNPLHKSKIGPSTKPSTSTSATPFSVPPFQFPDLGPPPPPSYGFHMLERRTIALADGTVRSYFALPHDYQDFLPPMPHLHRFGPTPGFYEGQIQIQSQNQNHSLKRKFEEDLKHGYYNNPNGARPDFRGESMARTSSPFRGRDAGGDESRAGKQMRIGGGDNSSALIGKHPEVDQNALKKAFLYYAKMINESEAERKHYLENGRQGRIHCLVCGTGRSSKDFWDVHSLIVHTYNSNDADHLGLHKALCVLMGWNYSKPPDNSKAYQVLPADEAAANQDDLVIWPPLVIIHNTVTGKGKEGRIEGLGNRTMDSKLRDLGFVGGKSKSLYGREGHLGVTLVKFSGDVSGLTEALRLAEYFEKDNRGRNSWGRIQPLALGKDEEVNPSLVKIDRNGEKTRVLYGYLGRVTDLCKLDFETRKRVTIQSQRDMRASK